MPTRDDIEALERIRKCIESEYQEAVQAWERLRRYLEQSNRTSSPLPTQASRIQAPAGATFRNGSYKSRVLTFLKSGPATIDKIAAATGLEKRQVRGVIYAKDMQTILVGTKVGSVMSFQYRGPRQENVDVA